MQKEKIYNFLIIIILILSGETIFLSIQNKEYKSKVSLYNKLSKSIENNAIGENPFFPNIRLNNRAENNIRFYEMIGSKDMSILIIQEECKQCDKLIRANSSLLKKLSDQIIGILMSTSYTKINMLEKIKDFDFYIIDKTEEKLINIKAYPSLIKIEPNGKILSQVIGYENISREIESMSRKGVK
jgi:hypothetical protein